MRMIASIKKYNVGTFIYSHIFTYVHISTEYINNVYILEQTLGIYTMFHNLCHMDFKSQVAAYK